jgi:hypothetical protein
MILPPLVFPGTVDLLVFTSLDKKFIWNLLPFFTDQATLMRRSTILSPFS